ncbi:DNA polymerase IV [Spirochaeta dissipatitropha]
MSSVFFHLDFDAFFASVEQTDKPELKGKPVIVGAAPGGRGVVAACSYEAREYGIHSAMPISIAARKCPHGVFLPIRMERYQEISHEVMNYLRKTAPSMHQISIDEAFLDYSGTERLLGQPQDLAGSLKDYILDNWQLPVSIGIGTNPYIAKLASGRSKPNGILHVQAIEELNFIDSFQLNKLWGIGPKICEQLETFNIRDTKQIRDLDMSELCAVAGKSTGQNLWNISRGLDPGIINEQPMSKSISTEHTFPVDISANNPAIEEKVLELCHSLMFRLLQESLRSATVMVRVRSEQFETHSCQKTLMNSIQSSTELYEESLKIMRPLLKQAGMVRLIGVGLSNVSSSDSHSQNEFFLTGNKKQYTVESAISQMQKKYGRKMITRASFLKKPEDDEL